MRMDEQRGLTDILVYLAVISLFALFGSGARLLYRWEERPITWARTFGTLMSSVFTAMIMGLLAWETMQAHPALLLALTGAASWLGAEFMDRLARSLSKTIMNRVNGAK